MRAVISYGHFDRGVGSPTTRVSLSDWTTFYIGKTIGGNTQIDVMSGGETGSPVRTNVS